MRSTSEVVGGARVFVREAARATGAEVFVTARPEPEAPGDAERVLDAFARAIAAREATPIAEKLYGRRDAKREVATLREAVWPRHGLDPAAPFTWIEGLPLAGEVLVGAQAWCVVPGAGDSVRTVDAAGARGRLWTTGEARVLYLADLEGRRADDALAEGGPAQAKQMFENAVAALRSQGMSLRDVARTWIYLSRLLDWYGDLNRVRTACYVPEGLGDGGVAFPASTGIQGRTGDEECLVDVLAVSGRDGDRVAVTPIHRSPRQDSSYRYGSAFSRGMVVAIDGVRTIHISGTASIDTTGASTHLGDAEMQSVETLLSISAILEEHGASLADIASATLYCKDARAFEAWERVTKLLGVPAFPRISVLADVCRDDLLVEMEAVALVAEAGTGR
jgi:enamine deaminase RidA (YjgF/YER057c/UK114 family)